MDLMVEPAQLDKVHGVKKEAYKFSRDIMAIQVQIITNYGMITMKILNFSTNNH